MHKLKYILIFATSAVMLGACTHQTSQETFNPTPIVPEQALMPAEESDVPDTISQSETDSYSLTEVAKHNTPEDCWMAIEGKVYDVSNYDSKHPGGDAIYQGCGQDATELFNSRPMGSKTPHSNTARSFLPNFYIGELAE